MKKIILLLTVLLVSSLFAETNYVEWKGQKINTFGNEIDGHALKSRPNGSFFLDVSTGLVSGHKALHKFGRNPSVSIGTYSTIWNGGGAYTGFDANVSEIVTISSSSSLDADAGTGLRTIRLYGLDANWTEQVEDIILDGTNDVNSTLSYLRLDTAEGLTAGSGKSNAGIITVKQSVTTANIFAAIPIGYNTSMIAAYTVPAGKTGYVFAHTSSIANKNAAAVSVRFQIRTPGEVFTVREESALNSQGSGRISNNLKIPIRVEGKTDLFIEADASASVAVTATIDILLIDN